VPLGVRCEVAMHINCAGSVVLARGVARVRSRAWYIVRGVTRGLRGDLHYWCKCEISGVEDDVCCDSTSDVRRGVGANVA
jgi:hypothetical protein